MWKASARIVLNLNRRRDRLHESLTLKLFKKKWNLGNWSVVLKLLPPGG
jgi:hypothetical protein